MNNVLPFVIKKRVTLSLFSYAQLATALDSLPEMIDNIVLSCIERMDRTVDNQQNGTDVDALRRDVLVTNLTMVVYKLLGTPRISKAVEEEGVDPIDASIAFTKSRLGHLNWDDLEADIREGVTLLQGNEDE